MLSQQRPFLLHLFSAVRSKGNMSDFTHHIISGNYEAVISTFFFPLQAHVFKAEALVSRWSALIPGDEKLLLALLQWSRPFPVIATSMHQEATACGGEISGISHAEPRKGTEAVGFDEWWIAHKPAHFHLGQLSDREKCFSLEKKVFFHQTEAGVRI